MTVTDLTPIVDLIVKKNDEIERLRAVLKEIAKDPPATLDEPDLDWEVIQKIRAIARAAISSGVRESDVLCKYYGTIRQRCSKCDCTPLNRS